MRFMQGKFSESYAPLGTMYIDFGDEKYTNYYRDLSLNDAVAKVSYKNQSSTISKEYFYSFPDQAFIIKLSSSASGKLNFTLRFDSQLKHSVNIASNQLQFSGRAPIKADPNYVRNDKDPVVFKDEKGTRFYGTIFIKK